MDYKRIKRELSIKTVLEHYGLMGGVVEANGKLRGRCNIHGGDCSTAFHADLDEGLWYCFSRDHGGTVVDLIAEIEHVGAREAAKIAERLLTATRLGADSCGREQPSEPRRSCKSSSVVRPLGFQLTLDPNHPYLDARGIAMKTRERFGLGYCSAGMFAGRLCIPIHDVEGILVGYAGRSVDGSEPKYLLPRGFPKSSLLYNHHRVAPEKAARKAIVVEGYFDVFRLSQAGYLAVALMGSSLSVAQAKLLLSMTQYLVLMMDGDEAGRKGTEQLTAALRGKKPFRVLRLDDGLQPDKLDERALREMIR